MALIKCVNCGHMISDRGVKCPNCGTAKSVVAVKSSNTYSNAPQKESAKHTLSICIWVVIMYILVILSLHIIYSLQPNINSHNAVYENNLYYDELEPVERNQYYFEE